MRKDRKNINNKGQGSIFKCLVLIFTIIIPCIYFLIKGLQITMLEIRSLFQIELYMAAAVCIIYVVHKLCRKWKYLHCDMYRIDRMTGIEFENFLRAMFEKKGYRVKQTPASHDYGVDLICTRVISEKSGEKEHIAIQAKRYRYTVGIAAVQQLIGGMHYYGCDKGMVITNSVFSNGAIKLAKKANVVLWDRKTLKRNLGRIRRC